MCLAVGVISVEWTPCRRPKVSWSRGTYFSRYTQYVPPFLLVNMDMCAVMCSDARLPSACLCHGSMDHHTISPCLLPIERMGDFIPWLSRKCTMVTRSINRANFRCEGELIIGPILDDRLKERFRKHWKGVLCIHFRVCVCVCVYPRATDHTFWHRNLFFGLSDSWDMRKKRVGFFSSKFSFLRFL